MLSTTIYQCFHIWCCRCSPLLFKFISTYYTLACGTTIYFDMCRALLCIKRMGLWIRYSHMYINNIVRQDNYCFETSWNNKQTYKQEISISKELYSSEHNKRRLSLTFHCRTFEYTNSGKENKFKKRKFYWVVQFFFWIFTAVLSWTFFKYFCFFFLISSWWNIL